MADHQKLEFLVIERNKKPDKEVQLGEGPFRVGFIGDEDYRNDYGTDLRDCEGGGYNHSQIPMGPHHAIYTCHDPPALSRNHCKFVLEDGSRVLKDLGSRTGTYLNGKRISNSRQPGSAKLTPGDVIGLIQKDNDFFIKIRYELREECEVYSVEE